MKPCIRRQEIKTFNRDGSQGTIHRCSHTLCEFYGKQVSGIECNECPLRTILETAPTGVLDRAAVERVFGQPKLLPDGCLVYEKRGLEPPPNHTGYQRKSADLTNIEAWVFIPLMPHCRFREMRNGVRPCGCVRIDQVCTNKESVMNGKSVLVKDCAECLVRLE
jgi:hypothetical protein